VEKALKAQRTLSIQLLISVSIALASKKPSDKEMMDLIKPLQASIMAVIDIKDKNRNSPQFLHLSTIAEGIPALGWVMVVEIKLISSHLLQFHILMSLKILHNFMRTK
jgi:adenylyl cyclase-associated protein